MRSSTAEGGVGFASKMRLTSRARRARGRPLGGLGDDVPLQVDDAPLLRHVEKKSTMSILSHVRLDVGGEEGGDLGQVTAHRRVEATVSVCDDHAGKAALEDLREKLVPRVLGLLGADGHRQEQAGLGQGWRTFLR